MSRALALRSLPPDVQAKLLGKRRSAEPTRVAVFLAALKAAGLPHPVREFRFDAHYTPQRRWRFDFCWPLFSLALEVEGGAWTRGRHTRGAGFIADLEKYSEAAAQGWLLLRVTPQQLCEDRTLTWIRRAMDNTLTPHTVR